MKEIFDRKLYDSDKMLELISGKNERLKYYFSFFVSSDGEYFLESEYYYNTINFNDSKSFNWFQRFFLRKNEIIKWKEKKFHQQLYKFKEIDGVIETMKELNIKSTKIASILNLEEVENYEC